MRIKGDTFEASSDRHLALILLSNMRAFLRFFVAIFACLARVATVCFGNDYSLDVYKITFTDEGEYVEPQIDLTATAQAKSDSSGKVIHISTFHDIKEACALLMDLMLAIGNQEDVYVSQYIAEKSKQI